MATIVPTCLCPQDSPAQSMAKINNNLSALFNLMSDSAFVGQTVNFGACLCSPAQILATINNNIAAFFAWYVANGGSGGGGNTVSGQANNSGDTTVTPASARHTEVLTIGGSARTSVFIADVAGRSDGDWLILRFVNPATAAIVEEVRDATAAGTLLYSYTTDGSGADNFTAILYFETGAWHALANAVPVV